LYSGTARQTAKESNAVRACDLHDVLVMLVVKSSIFYHKATCHNCTFAAARSPKEISRPARPLLIHRQPKDEEAAHT
jgi:hypothetical protein